MIKNTHDMRYAELIEDIKVIGFGVIAKGTRFEVSQSNNRFVYLKLQDRTTLKIARSKVKAVKSKRSVK